MHTIEGLQDLHSLNWLERLAGTLPAGRAKQKAVLTRIAELRGRLPVSLLTYHERQARQKRPSVVAASGASCGACHLRLPRGEENELRIPGRFVLCPNCGVFVTVGVSAAQAAESGAGVSIGVPA